MSQQTWRSGIYGDMEINENNLDINTSQTKELMEFRRSKITEHFAIFINEELQVLWIHIPAVFIGSTHICHKVGRSQKRLHFLRKLR